jgi:hypothetical protein
VLLFLEPAGEQVQRLERPAERRRGLESLRPDVVQRRHAEVAVQLPQRVLRPAQRLRRCNPDSALCRPRLLLANSTIYNDELHSQ